MSSAAVVTGALRVNEIIQWRWVAIVFFFLFFFFLFLFFFNSYLYVVNLRFRSYLNTHWIFDFLNIRSNLFSPNSHQKHIFMSGFHA